MGRSEIHSKNDMKLRQLLAGVCCCVLFITHSLQAQPDNAARSMAARLDSMGYIPAGTDSLIETFWKNGAEKATLLAVVADPVNSVRVRFLASEILFEKDAAYPAATDTKMLGQLYADALSMGIGGANIWGEPFSKNNYGYVGPHLLRIGKDAAYALAKLLGNKNPLFYGGSEKYALHQNSYKVRTCDFAAFYIGKIMGWKYKYHRLKIFRAHANRKIERKMARL